MKQEKSSYQSPCVEVMQIAVERGFSLSEYESNQLSDYKWSEFEQAD